MKTHSIPRSVVPFTLILGLIALLVITTWLTFDRHQDSAERAIQLEINQLSDILVNGMREPAWNLIPESGQPLLHAIMNDPRVVSVRVTTVAQGDFLQAEKRLHPNATSTVLSREIHHDGLKIGEIKLEIYDAATTAALHAEWRQSYIVLAIQLLLSTAVVYTVLRTSTRRLRERALADLNTELKKEVEERAQAEARLQNSENELRIITDNLPGMIAYIDSEERFQFANAVCAEWYRRPIDEIIGATVNELWNEKGYQVGHRSIQRALAGEFVTFDKKVRYPDGKSRDVLATYIPHVDEDGFVQGFFALVQDITERKQLEEQFHQSLKMEAMGRLVAGVAHEFNNVLQIIVSATGNLNRGMALSVRQTQKLDAIRRATGRGANLTDRLLSYVGKRPLKSEVLDPGEFLGGMANLLKPILGETIAVEVGTGDDLWPVTVDPSQLEGALLNLALNARDAMPEGGRLRIEAENVHLDAAFAASRPYKLAPGAYVKLSVGDTGSGMPRAVLERVFEPFFTTKEVGAGTGLGLSMVYGFVRRQSGGFLDIDSEPGAGTTVTLYLPRTEVSETIEAESGHQPAEEIEQNGTVGGTVLVVEDDVDVRISMVFQLEALKFQVLEAWDGVEALRIVETTEGIDLVLSDVVMPGGMDGVGLARAIQSLRPGIKIIMMSGYPEGEISKRGLNSVGVPLLRKPFREGELMNAISDVLKSTDSDKIVPIDSETRPIRRQLS